MAAAAILENRKNGQISGTVRPIAAKFGTMMHFDPLHGTLSAIEVTNFLKSKMTDGCQLESRKIALSG